MSYGVGCRCGPDPMSLWLWCKPAAIAPIRPLAWEPPYAMGVALEKEKKEKKKKLSLRPRESSGETDLKKANMLALLTLKGSS